MQVTKNNFSNKLHVIRSSRSLNFLLLPIIHILFPELQSFFLVRHRSEDITSINLSICMAVGL